MNLGAAGKALIQSFEKLRFVAYQDSGGVWTCGWGHTAGVTASTTCGPTLADQWFDEDTAQAVAGVNRDLSIAVTQNQFDALVSFGFNVGVSAEAHSTLISLVNAGQVMSASDEFMRWVHVDGVVSAGLVARRTAEQKLFNAPEESQ